MLAVSSDGSPNADVWEFPNGVYFTLCADPLGCRPGGVLDMDAVTNLKFLLTHFGEAGILNSWTRS